MKYPVLAALAVAVASLHAADEAKPAKIEKPLTPDQVKQAWTMLGFSIASQSWSKPV